MGFQSPLIVCWRRTPRADADMGQQSKEIGKMFCGCPRGTIFSSLTTAFLGHHFPN